MEAFCKTCNSVQEVEYTEEGSTQVYCLACGDEFPFVPLDTSGGKYDNYKVGLVVRVEPIAKSKDLKLCHIDVVGNGEEESVLPVVTNAKYVEPGWRVVVACIGAVVPAGATYSEGDDEDGVIKVSKRQVQGVESRGMICDCPMLGWSGGAKGFIQQLPDSFAVGSSPPDSRPRL
eukprot:gene316-338_t